jgi:hypothetical protein
MIDSESKARSGSTPFVEDVGPRVGTAGMDQRKGFVMLKLRYASAVVTSAVLTAVGMTGCATFCDECDDFPIPGGYAAMPGTYTGPPVTHGGESAPSTRPDETAKPFSAPGQPEPPTPEQAPPEPNAMNLGPNPFAPPAVAAEPAAERTVGLVEGDLPPLP